MTQTTAIDDALLAIHHAKPRRARGRAVAGEEPLDVPEIGEDAHAGRSKGPALRDKPYSMTASSAGRRGGMNASPSASIAPLPPRVGMTEHTVAPHSAARSIDRHAHSTASPAGMNGGLSSTNTRSAMSWRCRKSAARRNASSVIRLLSRASTSGCAVSSPIATSSRPGISDWNLRQRSRVRAGEKRRMRLDDHALEPFDLARDRLVILERNLLRIEEAAGVVQLDVSRRLKPGERGSNLRGNGAGGTRSSSVFVHRSHITQRNGHSRLVRKTTAVGTSAPDSSGSSSQAVAYARWGSTRFLAPRWSRTKRIHREFAPAGTTSICSDASARSPESASRCRSCQSLLNVRRHHAFETRSRGMAAAPSWNRRF